MIGGVDRPPQVVRLLEADPDLAEGLDDSEAEIARHRAVASVLEVDALSWDLTKSRESADQACLGLFLIEGLMIRVVSVGKRSAGELFGPGDLIRPWDTDGEYARFRSPSSG